MREKVSSNLEREKKISTSHKEVFQGERLDTLSEPCRDVELLLVWLQFKPDVVVVVVVILISVFVAKVYKFGENLESGEREREICVEIARITG